MSNPLPLGWEITTIGNFGRVVTGSTPSTQEPDYWGGEIPFISPADFNGSIYVQKTQRSLTKVGGNKGRLLPKDAVLVTCIGSLGGIAMAPSECTTNQQINAVISSAENNSRYCFYNILFNIDELTKNAGTTTIPIINKSTFELINLLRPPLPEQQKIAAILTTVDDVIESTQAQINKLKDLKTGMMQELLTKGIGHTEFKDSPMGRIPVSWQLKALPEVSNNLDSKRVPIKSTDRSNMKGEYRYYGASGVIDYVNDYIFDGEYILLGEDGENVLSRNLPLAFIVKGKYWVNNHAHVLEAKDGTNLKFLCEYLESLDYKNIASGSAQPKITQGVLNEILIPMPPIEEQMKISKILFSFDERLAVKKAKLDQTQKIKKALMQDLLTGKVRVNVN